MAILIIAIIFLAFPDESSGASRSEASYGPEFSSALFVIKDEVVLDLRQPPNGQVLKRSRFLVKARGHGYTNQSVVSLSLALLGLLRFEDANKTNLNQAPGESRLLHQDNHIQRIAVRGQSRWDGAEVKGEHRPRRQDVGDFI